MAQASAYDLDTLLKGMTEANLHYEVVCSASPSDEDGGLYGNIGMVELVIGPSGQLAAYHYGALDKLSADERSKVLQILADKLSCLAKSMNNG